MCPCIPDRIGIWQCWFLRRGGNRSTREKPLGARREPPTNSYDPRTGKWIEGLIEWIEGLIEWIDGLIDLNAIIMIFLFKLLTTVTSPPTDKYLRLMVKAT